MDGSQRKLTTPAEYARHRGVSRTAVSKAVRVGRLTSSIVRTDAGGYLIDKAAADAEWLRATDPTRLNSEGKLRHDALVDQVRAMEARSVEDDGKRAPTSAEVETLTPIAADMSSVSTQCGWVVLGFDADGDGQWFGLRLTPEDALSLGSALVAEALRSAVSRPTEMRRR